MLRFFKHLLLGKTTGLRKSKLSPFEKSIHNIKAIWNNQHNEDNGLEKIVRLLLSISLLIFPGTYIKNIAYKTNHTLQDLFIDIYILFKVAFPFIIIRFGLQENNFLIVLMLYFLCETFLYIPTLIFASDELSSPRSYKRSMLLLFLNYLEVVFAFAVLYTLGDNFNEKFDHWFDAVYFSFVTSSSIGYGDYFPITYYGKVLVSIQAMFFLTFLVLFINFFSNKIKTKGYFNTDEE